MTTMGVQKLAEVIKRTQDNENDVPIAVSGARGIGKSTFVLQLNKQILGEDYFTYEGFDKHNIYGRQELITKLDNFPAKSVLDVDEAINTLFKREFQQNKQNIIIKMLNTYRDKCFLLELLIPHFWDLDSSVRNSMIIKFWIHIYKRGHGIIFTPEDNPFTIDPWNQKLNYMLWKKGQIYNSPNYISNITWPDIDINIKTIYKKIKAQKRKSFDNEDKEPELTKKDIILAIKSINKSSREREIASVLGTDKSYVYQVIKAAEQAS